MTDPRPFQAVAMFARQCASVSWGACADWPSGHRRAAMVRLMQAWLTLAEAADNCAQVAHCTESTDAHP